MTGYNLVQCNSCVVEWMWIMEDDERRWSQTRYFQAQVSEKAFKDTREIWHLRQWSQTRYFPAQVPEKAFTDLFAYATGKWRSAQESQHGNFQQARRRRWTWIWHVLQMDNSSLPQVAETWALRLEGKCKRGRPRETWHKTVEKELKDGGLPYLSRDRAGGGWESDLEK